MFKVRPLLSASTIGLTGCRHFAFGQRKPSLPAGTLSFRASATSRIAFARSTSIRHSFILGIVDISFLTQILPRTRSCPAVPLWCTMLSMSMPETTEQWLLFKYVGLEFTPLSKPFKTKEQAEKARLKYPERQRKTIGLGVIRFKK